MMTLGLMMFVFSAAFAGGAQGSVHLPVPGKIDGARVRAVLPPDAIRAIDSPSFLSGTAAERQMARDEIVLGFTLGGVTRAYPLGYLTAHEIVNDRLGETPITVTW